MLSKSFPTLFDGVKALLWITHPAAMMRTLAPPGFVRNIKLVRVLTGWCVPIGSGRRRGGGEPTVHRNQRRRPARSNLRQPMSVGARHHSRSRADKDGQRGTRYLTCSGPGAVVCGVSRPLIGAEPSHEASRRKNHATEFDRAVPRGPRRGSRGPVRRVAFGFRPAASKTRVVVPYRTDAFKSRDANALANAIALARLAQCLPEATRNLSGKGVTPCSTR